MGGSGGEKIRLLEGWSRWWEERRVTRRVMLVVGETFGTANAMLLRVGATMLLGQTRELSEQQQCSKHFQEP